MFLAIDRVSRFTCVGFHDDAGKMNGADFLRGVVEAFPHAIHIVLTGSREAVPRREVSEAGRGVAFADLPRNRAQEPWPPVRDGGHVLDRVCKAHGIGHTLARPCHPWTNGQAERMNRTVKAATIKAFHHPDLASLRAQVLAFVAARNVARHLKAVHWKTPFEAICRAWTRTPDIFRLDPRHLVPGPDSRCQQEHNHRCFFVKFVLLVAARCDPFVGSLSDSRCGNVACCLA